MVAITITIITKANVVAVDIITTKATAVAVDIITTRTNAVAVIIISTKANVLAVDTKRGLGYKSFAKLLFLWESGF